MTGHRSRAVAVIALALALPPGWSGVHAAAGARTVQVGEPGPPELPAPTPLPPAPPAPSAAPADPPVPCVAVRVRVPAEAAPGQPLTYRLLVSNSSRAPAHHVRVRMALPSNSTFVRAKPEPAAMPTDAAPFLLWQLGTLAGCARREIEVVVMPGAGGDLETCARVQFEHGQCVRTRVAKPGLRLRKTGPAQAVLYDFVTYKLEVTNTGRAPLAGVVLTDDVPEGMKFQNSKPATSGDKSPLRWELGELRPGQTKGVEYTVIPMKVGSFTNKAACAAGGLRDEASHTVRVGEAKLAVTMSGPAHRLVGRPATYRITVRNTGTAPATNVQAVNEIPEDVEFLRATGGGRKERDVVRWALGGLAPGARKTVEVVVRAKRSGTLKNVVAVTADRGLAGQGRADTKFDAADGLGVEIDKADDPLEVGQEAVYTVRLINAGKAAETNLTLTVEVPEGLEVTGTKGPTTAKGKQKLTFDLLKRLDAKGEVAYAVRVRAVKAREVRLRASVTSDATGAAKPVTVEETTTVIDPKEGPAPAEGTPTRLSRLLIAHRTSSTCRQCVACACR